MARRNRYFLTYRDIRTGQDRNSALVSRKMADNMRARFGGTVREYVEGEPLRVVKQGTRTFYVPN